MACFFDVKCWGFSILADVKLLIINQMRFSKISQMIWLLPLVPVSCENRARTSPYLSGAKIVIFRKCRKNFREK